MTAENWDLSIKLALTLLLMVAIPWAIMAYQARTAIQRTDQQRTAVDNELNTAAGIIKTRLDQGIMSISDVDVENRIVMQEARAALARIPDIAAAQQLRPAAVAAIIVGKIDTSPPGAHT